MRILTGVLTATLLWTPSAGAQITNRVFTSPLVPPADVLDRLNLQLAWTSHLEMDGKQDSIFSYEIRPHAIIFLLRSGGLIALDPETGTTMWRNRIGEPYVPPAGFGGNSTTIFVAKGVHLYALDRATGKLQWTFRLSNAASAAPVADEERLFVPVGTNRLNAYTLPSLNATAVAVPKEPPPPRPAEVTPTVRLDGAMQSRGGGGSALGVSGQIVRSISALDSIGRSVRAIGPLSSAMEARQGEVLGPQPLYLWDYVTETRPETRVEQPSILTGDFLFQAGANGLFFTISKYHPRIFYRFQADAPVSAALGSYGETAYVASEDFRVYALEIVTGRILWRFVAGGPIRRQPRVTDDSVYVASERAGLYRVDRLTGDMIWRNPKADRFLAVNKKFVYAADDTDRLMILDRATGAELATYQGTREFVVPLSNELTDRIYLASNNGLVICLRDRDQHAPLQVKNPPEEKTLAAPTTDKRKPADKGTLPKPKDKNG